MIDYISNINSVVLSDERFEILKLTIQRMKYSDYKPVAEQLGISAVTCKRQADKAVSQIGKARKNCARIIPRNARRRFV